MKNIVTLRILGLVLFLDLTVPTRASVIGFDTFNGNNYFLLSENDWPDAQAEAIILGGNLTSVNSQAEQDFIWGLWGSFGNLLIGFTDQAIEGNFEWISGEPVVFTNWDIGEPNNGLGGVEEDFARMEGPGGLWVDFSSSPGGGGGVVKLSTPAAAPEFSGITYGIPNFGWIASRGGGLLGLAVIRQRHSSN